MLRLTKTRFFRLSSSCTRMRNLVLRFQKLADALWHYQNSVSLWTNQQRLANYLRGLPCEALFLRTTFLRRWIQNWSQWDRLKHMQEPYSSSKYYAALFGLVTDARSAQHTVSYFLGVMNADGVAEHCLPHKDN